MSGRLALAALAALLCAAAPAGAGGETAATWSLRTPIADPQDIAGPLRDGRFVLAAGGTLHLYDAARRRLTPYAPDYVSDTAEPYIAMAPRGLRGPGGCSYGREAIYAIETGADAGLIRVSRAGRVRRFADLDGFGSAIAFDRRGEFGHRLLVVLLGPTSSTLKAFDCRGRAETVVADAPRIEGGMAIAPRSFGRFGGDLVAPDEFDGSIYALSADGRVRLVAESAIAAGPDIGVESAGFVPRLGRGGFAIVADAGRDSILGLSRAKLRRQNVLSGDLVVAAEGKPTPTVAVRCAAGCDVRQVATGPDSQQGHAEGHLKFFRGDASSRR